MLSLYHYHLIQLQKNQYKMIKKKHYTIFIIDHNKSLKNQLMSRLILQKYIDVFTNNERIFLSVFDCLQIGSKNQGRYYLQKSLIVFYLLFFLAQMAVKYFNLYQFFMSNSVHCAKWDVLEEKKFLAAVRKHGTQWKLVQKSMNNTRSINSIVKRWHGKMKHTTQGKKIQQQLDKRQQEQEEEEDEEIEEEQSQSGEQSSQEKITWKKNWTQTDDTQLKSLILRDEILDWKKLAGYFTKADVKEVKNRWCKVLYPKIKQAEKIGGALKWSGEEDAILIAAVKADKSWQFINQFLPSRSQYSIEARWRRISKIVQNSQAAQLNKHILRKIVLLRLACKEKEITANKEDQIVPQ